MIIALSESSNKVYSGCAERSNNQELNSDLLFENCPEEASDSNDEVYYFNVNREWKSMLARRSWCNP